MGKSRVLLDANILYSAPLRDLFLQLTITDLFHAKWTADIHREWIESLLRKQSGIDRRVLEKTRDLMNFHALDCLIESYEPLIPSLTLPDPDDRHVLAAAITGHCTIIVTKNLRDFPEFALKPYGVQARHPDGFLHDYLKLKPVVFCEAVHAIRTRLQNPPRTATEYLNTLSQQDLTATAAELEQYAQLI